MFAWRAALAGALAFCGLALGGCPKTTDSGSPAEAAAEAAAEPWGLNDPTSTLKIDHSLWDDFLQKYAHTDDEGVTRIDYGAVEWLDRQHVRSYLDYLQSLDIAAYTRDEQIAFWMNLYNAAAVDLILDKWPVDSILQIRGPGLNVVGPWLKKIARVSNTDVTFNDVEHYILRPYFNDMGLPIHYGVNCASVGCPTMAVRAHTGDNWLDNLSQSSHSFINSPQGVRIEDGQLLVSKVYYSWFIDDFGGSDATVIAHLKSYADPELAKALDKFDTISGDFYDWRLNKAH
jgi:hypothetical protein